ncbi:MAG: transcription elongation factor GreA [Acidobacteriota bacterium]|nr:transcription elongation factor GreA [Acidobacteriota bacterium]
MTKKLLERMNADFKELEYELKTVLPEEIARAASLGDLSENAEYEAALDRQRLLQSKYRTLKNRINEIAQIDISRIPQNKTGYGSIIEVYDLDDDKDLIYQLVMPEDADVKRNRISVGSPIGKALMNRNEGDEVSIRIPSGTKNYEITGFKPYAETEQDL